VAHRVRPAQAVVGLRAATKTSETGELSYLGVSTTNSGKDLHRVQSSQPGKITIILLFCFH